MVSPCKKKTDKKGKPSVSTSQSKGATSGVRSWKPLTGKKIYLDIRNPVTAKKLEQQIISLGGEVETFLVSDVSHLVTDRKSGSSTEQRSDHSSLSPTNAALANARTRSRGVAMLNRVRQGEAAITTSPTLDDLFERAAALGVPVYPLVRFTEYIAKLLRRAERSSGHHKARELRGTYLKLETGLRPEVRVGSWPRINLNVNCGSAFTTPHNETENPSRMTRKSGGKLLGGNNKNSTSGAAAGAGYCEVCRVNYDWVEEHVSSVGHIKAVTDPSQYQELDSLISASSGTTAAWLGQRKSCRLRSPTPLHSPPPPTILNCNGHTPTNNHQSLPNGIRSGERVVRSNSVALPTGGGRRGRVVRKRLSAEEKLIEDNRAYYKVEVLNSKLRSTGTLQRQLGSSGGREDEEGEDSGEGGKAETETNRMGAILGSSPLHNGQTANSQSDSVVVRFKKVRRTELSTLNDEAENFMFGERDAESHEASPLESADSAKKKRRTHAELFINDNADYYKFELSGSRLRYQGTTLAHVPTPTKEEARLRSPPCDLPSSRLRSGGKSPPNHRSISDKDEQSFHRSRAKSPAPLRHQRSFEEPTHHRLRSNRSPSVDEPTHHLRLRNNRSPNDDEPAHHHRLRSNRSPTDDEPAHHHRLRSNRSPTDDEPAHHHRLRSNRSPTDEEPNLLHRLRSNRSPTDDEQIPHHRLRSNRSPAEDEPILHHRLRSNRSPADDEPTHHHRLRSNRSPVEDEPLNHRTRSNRSPLDEESSYSFNHRLRSIRSPTEEEPNHHHRLRSAGKSPGEELTRLRWNRSPTDEEPLIHRLRSGGRNSTDEEAPSNNLRLRSSRNLYEEDISAKGAETSRPSLRSSSQTPPPLEPKLRSCPGLSPVKDRLTERPDLPSEDDLAPELSLTHTDITYAFEMSNTDPLSAQIQERLEGYKEDILPRYFGYPNVVLPCEMPYLDRLKLLTRRKRRMSRCLDDKPRKSPRCHASTLAIMSSVLPKCGAGTPQSCGGTVVTAVPSPATVPTEPSSTAEDEETTASSLTVDSTLSDPSNDPKALYLRYLSHFASLLDSVRSKDNKSWEPLSPQEDNSSEAALVQCHSTPPDFVWMMDNDKCPDLDACLQDSLFNFRSFDLDSCNSSDCSEIFGFSDDGRSYFGRRKKKKRHNLTGWPKEKPKRKLLGFAKKQRFIKSEPPMLLSYSSQLSSDPAQSPSPKKRGRPRIYPPGMSPSFLKVKLARENALRRSSSLSPVKPRPSLKVHPL